MDLDTVIIDPETGRTELVEARLHIAAHAADRHALEDLLPLQRRAELDGEVTHGA